MTSFHTRAVKIFGTCQDGINWPYGLHNPQWHLKRTSPEQYERELTGQPPKQRAIVDWAERYGLKASTSGCCPKWLQGNVSRRCWPSQHGSPCTHYGSNGLDSHWLDHTVWWLKSGKPAAITSAPYNLDGKDRARIDWWLTEDPRLRVAYGTGWYGHGTTQVVMWRADRIKAVQPAAV